MEVKNSSDNRKNDWHQINFSVPIESSSTTGDNDFVIEGTAINSVLTRNGVEFVGEELQKGAMSLKNKPLLKDHKNSVDSLVGRVIESTYSDSNKNVQFRAKVMDETMIKMIKDGRLTSVSVGALVDNLEEIETENSSYLRAIGIDFVELSLVAVPADPNAGLAQAIKASYELKQSLNKDGDKKMSEKVEEKKTENINSSIDAVLEAVKATSKNVETLVESQKKLDERLTKLESNAEEDSQEEKVEETKPVVDNTEGEVDSEESEEVVEEKYGMDLIKSEAGGMMFTVSNYNGTKNLNRGIE